MAKYYKNGKKRGALAAPERASSYITVEKQEVISIV